ncbi:Bacterioferritin [Thermogutta terrifontis]|jgi:bacterioferritin|uniref:Bacterioferritin n=1 Tax=Thermogutta terrifontis TaxID=1331910 RepID=A0A286RGL6_9BACT|nr:bacterioferritin [Thermogutta terrifontis]ASV75087.1 Bacterioferritin [Thermogutta terrifontis]
MKGNEKLIAVLNELLAEELTAIVQYIVHSEMCADWGYDHLHEAVEKRAIQEMKHAESLIARIIFLEGTPIVNRLNEVRVGPNVADQFRSDLNAELTAVQAYNKAIALAHEVGDAVTRELLESIVKDEDHHVNWLEEQLAQIEQMGLQIYLSTQAKG